VQPKDKKDPDSVADDSDLSDLIKPYTSIAGRKAGKPRSALPMDLITRLGPPPMDATKRSGWYAMKLAMLDYGISLGHPWQALAHTTRQNAMADLRLSGELMAGMVKKMLDRKHVDAELIAGDPALQKQTEAKDDGAKRPQPLRINPK
jgi:hypothetical protein